MRKIKFRGKEIETDQWGICCHKIMVRNTLKLSGTYMMKNKITTSSILVC